MSVPSAPDDRECVAGTELAGKAEGCKGCPNASVCADGPKGPDPDVAAVDGRMALVRHKLLVLSGKGGVGKSTFSTQLSLALAADSPATEVGLLDIDICGPSVPRMLGLLGEEVRRRDAFGWQPVYADDNLAVMSVGFMLESEDAAVVWRGPKKNGLIKQFLRDVEWGVLDYLVVDTPPGTSDEHLSITQYLQSTGIDGAIIVTTPQEVALLDVRKEINFCVKNRVRVLGVVENMAGFVCPNCKHESIIFKPSTGGAARMAQEMGVPFLGSVPLDPRLARACDEGKNFVREVPDSPATKAILDIVAAIKQACAN